MMKILALTAWPGFCFAIIAFGYALNLGDHFVSALALCMLIVGGVLIAFFLRLKPIIATPEYRLRRIYFAIVGGLLSCISLVLVGNWILQAVGIYDPRGYGGLSIAISMGFTSMPLSVLYLIGLILLFEWKASDQT